MNEQTPRSTSRTARKSLRVSATHDDLQWKKKGPFSDEPSWNQHYRRSSGTGWDGVGRVGSGRVKLNLPHQVFVLPVWCKIIEGDEN